MSTTTQLEHGAAQPELDGLIVKTPDTCGGKARIAGTRIWVRLIHQLHEVQNLSVAEILEEYPHLTKAGIYAALAYYWSHPEEMRQEEEREARTDAELEAAQPSLVERIDLRMK